jgi:cupin superfamily acireductone dioxygenase involved in methionine salvage
LLVKDDMIILPAGIYHRFTTNEQNVCDCCEIFYNETNFCTCSTSRPCASSRTSLSGPR